MTDIGDPAFDPAATRMEPTDIVAVGNNTDEDAPDSHNIPASAVRRCNADYDTESIQGDHNSLSTLKDVNRRAKIKIQDFINGVLKSGVDALGIAWAYKQRIETSLDMTGAEMIRLAGIYREADEEAAAATKGVPGVGGTAGP